jgi:APA family basic amino acid/polyamine antiporter
MLLNYSKSLVQAFTFMMKLSTLSVLTPYLFSSAVLALLAYRKNLKNKKRIISLSCAAFIFSIWMVIGSGQEIVFWGFLLLMVGLPVYIYLEKDNDYE